VDGGAIDDPKGSSPAHHGESIEDFWLLLIYPLQKVILDKPGWRLAVYL
jgi:hypothetical protein